MATSVSIGGREVPLPMALAAFGLVSGVLSATLTVESASGLKLIGDVFGLSPELLPMGLYFGLAVAIGIWLATGNVWSIPVLLVTTMYAWSAAVQLAIRLQRNSGDDIYLIAASLAAGAAGAGLTHLGCALFAPGLRRPRAIAMTCLVGAVAGMLFYLSERNYINARLLYIVWQPAVAFCIGSGLMMRPRNA